jgi:hypothetical protein
LSIFNANIQIAIFGNCRGSCVWGRNIEYFPNISLNLLICAQFKKNNEKYINPEKCCVLCFVLLSNLQYYLAEFLLVIKYIIDMGLLANEVKHFCPEGFKGIAGPFGKLREDWKESQLAGEANVSHELVHFVFKKLLEMKLAPGTNRIDLF